MSLPTFKVHAWGWRLIIFATVFITIYYIKLWQPERQIELHQKNFLIALENRNWSRVKAELSENYSDRFGHNRETVISDLREVLRPFFALTIRRQGTHLVINSDSATMTTNITITGTGTGATEWVAGEVNRLVDPWVFTWQKASFWPWDWRLVSVDNPGLNLANRRINF